MARIALDTYYKSIFKNDIYSNEFFKEINRAHVISSEYYDVQFGRDSLLYRDKNNKVNIPIEHDLSHILIIHFDYFFENNKCDIAPKKLKERISTALDFLKAKYQYE